VFAVHECHDVEGVAWGGLDPLELGVVVLWVSSLNGKVDDGQVFVDVNGGHGVLALGAVLLVVRKHLAADGEAGNGNQTSLGQYLGVRGETVAASPLAQFGTQVGERLATDLHVLLGQIKHFGVLLAFYRVLRSIAKKWNDRENPSEPHPTEVITCDDVTTREYLNDSLRIAYTGGDVRDGRGNYCSEKARFA
jgi:hypothetical protein